MHLLLAATRKCELIICMCLLAVTVVLVCTY